MMKNILLYTTISILLFAGCSGEKSQAKKAQIGNVTYEIPSDWTELKTSPIDSKIISYLTENRDTIILELGMYNNRFDETVVVVPSQNIYDFLSDMEFSKSMRIARDTLLDIEQSPFLKNYYYYDTIDNRVAKLMFPKKGNEGSIGIYFDSIDKEKNRFSIYCYEPIGENTKEELIKVFYSLRIE